jgi:serine/threonine protein kinase
MSDRVFLGGYKQVRLLAEGGMSRIYIAASDQGREVAVKVLRDELLHNTKARKHFEREIRLLSQLRHPNAVEYIDACPDGAEGPFLVMEYVHGSSLDQLLVGRGRIPAPRVGRFLSQLCDLLTYIHSQGIVHRDLKPGNLMMVQPGSARETLKVMDFGLASLTSALYIAPEDLVESRRPVISGTPQYACPEQARGEEMDARGDLYSVGVILFEMLTGRRPFRHASVKEMLAAHEKETPPAFAQVGASLGIPPAVEGVVQACLAKSPGSRPQSAAELDRRFQEALGAKASDAYIKPAGATSVPLSQTPPPNLPPSIPDYADPNAVVYELQASMVESIALLKLKGFVQDLKGRIIESVPGLIRVYFVEEPAETKDPPPGRLSWFGKTATRTASPPCVMEMRLHLAKQATGRSNDLALKLVLRPKGPLAGTRTQFRARCDKIHRDLQAYLIS